ncbi:flagellin [Thalassolituus sp. LLYu03]|uniref:flagellin N-terminal helical domain-containing protein n=1 Tax=Thalassolituus sp. LLYu03 TaxID=3421656 RepID=UPI003D2DC15D
MPQIINTNIASINAQRNLDKSQSANQQALQRLSSGLRINSAKDDAAGLAISTRFTSQIKGLNVAVRNAGDGIALAQTAEGALGSMNDNLQRIRELAVQSANATNSDVDREALQAEVDQLVAEISRTADETDFNGRKLLDGSFSATFQIGANAGQTVDVSISELTASKLGSSKTAGLSAQGSDNGLQNGDLIINGVAISPSNSDDDTASVDNQAASAIAKVAAINSKYDETGVKAFVNTNTVSGSEMVANALSGNIILNGVEISIQTTTDAATTRASVAQAINAVAEQTGVTAINTDSDSLGVTLVAADGRNISLGVDTTNGFGSATLAGVAEATGLALGASYNTVSNTGDYETYEGGYTLVADGDVKSIEISGGDGTGNGDLKNAGLTEGSYDRGVAQVTSIAQTETTNDSIGSTAFFALEGSGTVVANQTSGSTHDLFNTAGNEILTISDGQGNSVTLGSAGSTVDIGIASGGFGADKIRDALNSFTGVSATAETKVTLSGASLIAQSAGSTLKIYDTGTAGTELASISFAGNTTSDTAQTIAAQINAMTTGLVATVLGTAGNSDVQIVDVNGNTLSFNLFSTSAGAGSISMTVNDRAGGTSAALSIAAGSSAANSTGSAVVAVGYIKDIEVDDPNVGEFSLTSNMSLSSSSTATGASLGVITTYLATNGSLSSTATTGIAANDVDVTAASVAITQPLTGLGDGDLVINGVNIGAADPTTDTSSAVKDSDGNTIKSSLKEASGIAVAAAINAVSEETGVTAVVNETVVVGGTGDNFDDGSGGGASYIAGDSGKLYINGVDLGTVTLLDDGTGKIDEGRTRQATIDLINAKSGQTGVTAEDNGESITLRAADGRNISVAIDNDSANNVGRGNTFGAQIGLDSAVDGIGEADIGTGTNSNTTGARGVEVEGDVYETTYSTVTLQSASEITIQGGTNGADELESLGFSAGSFGGGENGQFLTDIDITTFEGAQAAITAIDNAIGQVASQRADLGAIQNRMESTVSNLQITSENLNSANSRIQDADFASETAELSRTQVLQQAGISVLAQANASGQQVLSLLG